MAERYEMVGLRTNDVEALGVQIYTTRRKDEQEWIRIFGKADVPPTEVLPESETVHEHRNRQLVRYGHLIFHMPIPVASDRVNKAIYLSDISSLRLLIFVSLPCRFL
jgi:hypothetical protein